MRSSAHQPKIVVISVFGDEGNVIESIQRGADGYMLKGGDAGKIAEAVEQVMAGMAPISPAIAGHMLRRIRRQEPKTGTASAKGVLTPREVEILHELAKGLTYRELGEQLCISHHTVNDHLKSIYRKLAVNSRVGRSTRRCVPATSRLIRTSPNPRCPLQAAEPSDAASYRSHRYR